MTWPEGEACEFTRDERGASLPEYALLLALITIVCIAAMSTLGSQISSFLASLASTL
jgi:pilus assembly protein Flp/PilA